MRRFLPFIVGALVALFLIFVVVAFVVVFADSRGGLPQVYFKVTDGSVAAPALSDVIPGCGGVLGANSTLKDVHAGEYACALCAAGYEPTLENAILPQVSDIEDALRRLVSF